MRGANERQAAMLLGVTPEDLVPASHPIRRIRAIVDAALERMSPQLDAMYGARGRPSIPPEHLLKGTLLMALYSIRSERQFCERLQYDLLFKWFLGLNIADAAFHPTSFSKNRERLLAHDIATAFLGEVVREARSRHLLSEDHFSADGTLLQAWASIKSYRPNDHQEPPPGSGGRNPEVHFHGERRSRETHHSRTDPEALLFKKAASEAARLSYIGNALVENRSGLVFDVLLTQATGGAEREALVRMLDRMERKAGMTVGADKGYDTYALHEALAAREAVGHLTWNDGLKKRPIPETLSEDPGYVRSQRRRKIVEEVFGWMKTVGATRKLRYIGLARNQLWLSFTAAAYNLVRMTKLEAATA